MRRPFDRSLPVIRRLGRPEPKEEAMGTLLDFATASRPTTRVGHRTTQRREAGRETFGEVILFPGVRYEHHDLDLAARIATIGKAAGPAGSDKD